MKLHCNRCGHEWTPRGEGRPSKCARCKSRVYDSARVYQLSYKQHEPPSATRAEYAARVVRPRLDAA
jgi:DNA-directed RNA polymerase subunit RPC12/RpoP